MCSSDLLYKAQMPKRSFEDSVIDVLRLSEEQWGHFRGVAGHWLGEPFHVDIPKKPPVKLLRSSRSEERRVGKECRSRWSPYH